MALEEPLKSLEAARKRLEEQLAELEPIREELERVKRAIAALTGEVRRAKTISAPRETRPGVTNEEIETGAIDVLTEKVSMTVKELGQLLVERARKQGKTGSGLPRRLKGVLSKGEAFVVEGDKVSLAK